jgi:hypothetical protein
MPQTAAPNTQTDADRLEVATDQAIAACGGEGLNLCFDLVALFVRSCGLILR